ncbi:MAG: hypothetical protein M3325_09730, partial [Actinomycetota bacterium]|nr:hypothetical protein [Actinomycetota bacterium]
MSTRTLDLSIPLHRATLGTVLLERGELDQAAAAVEGGALPIGGPTGIALLEARGRVRLARGQREQAITDLRHCGQLAVAVKTTPNLHPWR